MSRKILLLLLIAFNAQFLIYAQLFHEQYFKRPPLVLNLETVPEVKSKSAVLIDAETGTLLYFKNGNEEIPPASLAKLMAMHIAMKEIAAGRASPGDIVPITEESWARNMARRSSLMFLEPGQIVTLKEILLGLAVPSGNDAAVAAALHFAPGVREFGLMMTAEARDMGLSVTRFVEPSGLSEENMTTAAEFAFFCMRYIKLYPDNLREYHSVPEFSYPLAANVPGSSKNRLSTITQSNRNSLLGVLPGVDGLKTGYIEESGYNIALTAERENTRFISVTLGADSIRERETDGTVLMSWAFENFKTVRVNIDQIEKARLWKGKDNYVELKLAHSADFTSPVDRSSLLVYEFIIDGPLIAPLPAGFPAGHLVICDEYGEVNKIPLITAAACEKGNIFKRIWHSFRILFMSKNNT